MIKPTLQRPPSLMDLLTLCNQQGVSLTVVNDGLRVNAPGTLDPDLRAALVHHKPSIIARLSQLHPNPFPTSEPLKFSVSEFLAYLRVCRLSIRVEAGKLHVSDPDPDAEPIEGFDQALAQHHDALVDLLIGEANATTHAGVQYDRGSIIIDKPASVTPRPTTTF